MSSTPSSPLSIESGGGGGGGGNVFTPSIELESYGCGCANSRRLGFMLRPLGCLIWMCAYVFVQGMAVTGFLSMVRTALERRYKFGSAASGAIGASYELTCCAAVLVVGYMGRDNKMRFMGIGSMVIAIGCAMFSLPQLLSGPYMVGTSSDSDNGLCSNTTRPVAEPDCDQKHNNLQLAIFCISYAVMGVGSSPFNALSNPFIKEITTDRSRTLYLAILYLVASIGKASGHLFSKLFLSIYVDIEVPSDLEITPQDERWVGAWWMGYYLASVVLGLVGLIMAGYPSERRLVSTSLPEDSPSRRLLPVLQGVTKDRFRQQFSALIKNKLFLVLVCALAVEGFTQSAYAAFLPKILEIQLYVSSSDSGLYTGIIYVPGACVGLLLGGMLPKLRNWNARRSILFSLLASLVSTVGTLILILGCPGRTLAGVDKLPSIMDDSMSAAGSGGLYAACNEKCLCSPFNYQPICDSRTMTTYFSPCFAGCSSQLESVDGLKTFSGCTCLDDPSAILKPERCSRPCSFLVPVLAGHLLLIIFSLSTTVPLMDVVLKTVKEHEASMAMGIHQLLLRLVGYLPGPVALGLVIDRTCSIWHKDKCISGRGHCVDYDVGTYRLYSWILFVSAKLLACLLLVLAYHISIYKSPPPPPDFFIEFDLKQRQARLTC